MVHSDGNLIKLSGKSKFVLINKFDNFAAKLLALCSSYLYHFSIISDSYRSVWTFVSDRPSVSIRLLITSNELYPPNFFKKIIFSFLTSFGTLNYGESPYIIYFCSLELFVLLFFIAKLATDIATSFTCFKPQYYTRKPSFYLFSMFENPVKPRIIKSCKNLDKQDKIDLEKQTLNSGLQNG